MLNVSDINAVESAIESSPGLCGLADCSAQFGLMEIAYGPARVEAALGRISDCIRDPRVTGEAVWADLDSDE